MVNYSDYVDGHEEANDLIKAMQAGAITGRDTVNQPLTQEPLKVESLERSLKLLETKMEEIKLYNSMPKITAHNTVEEFLQLQSYGSERGGFYGEGELADVEDSVYIRRAEKIKYMQVTGEVTIQAQMVTSYVPAMTQEIKNKMMWILKLANRSLTKADEEIIPQEFNSLYKQHASVGGGAGFLYSTFDEYFSRSEVVIDLRGKSLTQNNIEDASVRVDDNHGTPNTLYAPSRVLSAFAQDYYEKQRILINAPIANSAIPDVPKGVTTTISTISLMPDKFMKADPPRKIADPATSTKAPAIPVVGGTPVALAASTLAKFVSGDAGNAYYAVSAINRYGESNLLALGSAAVTLAVGSGVDLQFTAGAGAYAASGYVIYRTKVTTAGAPTNETFYPVFKVSTAQLAAGFNGAAAGKIRDLGYFLPNTDQAFLTQMDDEVLSFKQLAPMSKLDLAIISASRRFMVFLFGSPNMYAPKKFVRFVNVANTYVA